MAITVTQRPSTAVPSLESIEATLLEWLGEPVLQARARPARGRPPILAASLLWAGLLVCVLRGFSAQRQLWLLLSQWGLWHFPRVDVSDMAVYKRLERSPPTAMAALFAQVSQAIAEQWSHGSSVAYAPFANAIVALDRTTLDKVLRKLKVLRDVPADAAQLLAGTLTCLFDLRRQQWLHVEYRADTTENEKKGVRSLLQHLAQGTLLLFDLGYFSFPWLDTLTAEGYFFVCRFREKLTFETVHLLYEGRNHLGALKEELVYLGKYRADRAAYPVRLITISVGNQSYRYLTNVLDPRLLPAWQVAGLYQRRWDIEGAFNLLKTHLGLHLLWSAHPNVILHQVWATMIIAQVVLAMRAQIAHEAKADVREVSLELLVRWLPIAGMEGRDPIEIFVQRGRAAGFIRPFRGRDQRVLRVTENDYVLPEEWPPKRKARYAGKQGTHPKGWKYVRKRRLPETTSS